MYIGMTLQDALAVVDKQNTQIIYNNNDKLIDFDTQLVVSYKKCDDKVVLVVSNFKLKV
ncbi:MAG: hypothetical protein RR348_04255 [Clostridia bacterium]